MFLYLKLQFFKLNGLKVVNRPPILIGNLLG